MPWQGLQDKLSESSMMQNTVYGTHHWYTKGKKYVFVMCMPKTSLKDKQAGVGHWIQKA